MRLIVIRAYSNRIVDGAKVKNVYLEHYRVLTLARVIFGPTIIAQTRTYANIQLVSIVSMMRTVGGAPPIITVCPEIRHNLLKVLVPAVVTITRLALANTRRALRLTSPSLSMDAPIVLFALGMACTFAATATVSNPTRRCSLILRLLVLLSPK